MKKSFIAGVSALALGAMLGAGTFAAFTDSEASADQKITMGTLDLEDGGTISSDALNVSNLKPGGEIASKDFTLHNAGTLAGSGTWKIVIDDDNENGTNEAEKAADGDTDGELAEQLQVSIDNAPYVSLRAAAEAQARQYSLTAADANGTGDDKTVELQFRVLDTVGNEIQTDFVAFHIEADFRS